MPSIFPPNNHHPSLQQSLACSLLITHCNPKSSHALSLHGHMPQHGAYPGVHHTQSFPWPRPSPTWPHALSHHTHHVHPPLGAQPPWKPPSPSSASTSTSEPLCGILIFSAGTPTSRRHPPRPLPPPASHLVVGLFPFCRECTLLPVSSDFSLCV